MTGLAEGAPAGTTQTVAPAQDVPAQDVPAQAAPAAAAPARSRPVSPTAREVLRRLRFPLALVALILVAGAAAVLLQPHAGPAYLDPRDAGPLGSRALAQLLAQRGVRVMPVSTPQEAARAAAADTTLVITGSAFLDHRELVTLGALPGGRVLIEPDASSLRVLAPGLIWAGDFRVAPADPGCGLAAAQLAGDADMGGVALHVTAPVAAGAQQCYHLGDGPSLVRYVIGGRTVTVLGTGVPLTNGSLADRGDAALTLNLLASQPTIIWLTPGTAALTPGATGRPTLADLVPWPVYLIAIQLAVAIVALAFWRIRRLGPLVTEPLPVVVRAAETVEGHGRLYRSRHSRDQAAAALRGAAIDRLVPRLGLAADAEQATIAAAAAARSGRGIAAVDAALFGPVPGTDAALVQLANDLDTLESEVRQT